MGTRLTAESVSARLAASPRKNGGVVSLVRLLTDTYPTRGVLRCSAGHEFETSVAGFLNRLGNGCSTCRRSNPDNFRKNVRSYESVIQELEEKCPNVRIVDGYTAISKPCNLKCQVCSHTWESTLYQILKGDRGDGCPECSRIQGNARKAKPEDTFLSKMRELYADRLILVGPYSKATAKLSFRCLDHDLEFAAVGSAVLRGKGCPACAAGRSYKHKPHKLGSRTVHVQGYEPAVLDRLAAQLGSSNVHVCSEGKVPKIAYKFKGELCEHRPDIIAGGVIHEVKSSYTLGMSNAELFRRNQAKAKAAFRAGYTYIMNVVHRRTQEVYVLPDGWTEWTLWFARFWLLQKGMDYKLH